MMSTFARLEQFGLPLSPSPADAKDSGFMGPGVDFKYDRLASRAKAVAPASERIRRGQGGATGRPSPAGPGIHGRTLHFSQDPGEKTFSAFVGI